MSMYTPELDRLQKLVTDNNLVIDYDPVLTTADILCADDECAWGAISMDGVSPLLYEREDAFIQTIEEHLTVGPIRDIHHAEVQDQTFHLDMEKKAMMLRQLDGDMWYAASLIKYTKMTPHVFGKEGRIWLTRFEELALISALKEGGQRRVGYNRVGGMIRGTLQLQFPGKVNWGTGVYLYEVDPHKLDLTKVWRKSQFQYEAMLAEIVPQKVYRSNFYGVKRKFDVKPLFSEEKK